MVAGMACFRFVWIYWWLIGWLNWSPEGFPVSSFWISMFLGLLVWLVCGLVADGCHSVTLCMGGR